MNLLKASSSRLLAALAIVGFIAGGAVLMPVQAQTLGPQQAYVSGSISTQNLAPTTATPTANSAVCTFTGDRGVSGVQATGTWTAAGGLTAIGTINNVDYVDITSFTAIASGVNGVYKLDAAGYQKVCVTAKGAVTGTANVVIRTTAIAAGGSGGGGAGDASAANQVTGNNSLASIDGKLPALSGGRVPVDGSGVTQPVSAAALPLPAGAATAANQVPGNSTAYATVNRAPVTLPDNAAITTSTCSANNCTLFTGVSTAGYESFYYQNTTASGTYTVNLQGSVDGTTYTDLKCQDASATGSTGTSLTSTSTGAGLIQCRAAPLIQAKVLAYTSGTITASAVLSLKQFQPLIAIYAAASLSVNAGQAAHDAAVSGNPVRIGCHGSTAQYATTIVNNDTVDVQCDLNGATITKPYSVSGSDWTTTVNLTDTTSTALKAAAGASIKNYVTWCVFSGLAATTATKINILDGSTVKLPVNMKAAGAEVVVTFPTPIAGTANTAMNVQLGGSPTGAIDVTCGGYQGQ
jgi:hypothetical protein